VTACTRCGAAPSTHALPLAHPPVTAVCQPCAGILSARRDYPAARVVPLFAGRILTCGQCGHALTLESDLSGGEDCLRCLSCSVTVANVAGTGNPEVCAG
jgi:hypothetical protein